MESYEELRREIDGLRERVSRLCAAVHRISASLDLDTVLHEVVESARELTGSRYGLVTTIDEAGEPEDFVTSGLTADEHRMLKEWPDGPRLFEHLRDLPGVLRLSDINAYVRSLGFSADLLPYKTFQGTPMRHRNVHVGNFYLVKKEGGAEFTSDDEEVLTLFRLAGGDGGRQRTRAPRRTADAGRPGSSGRDLTCRRGGLRCEDGQPGVAESRVENGSWRACAFRASPRSSFWR